MLFSFFYRLFVRINIFCSFVKNVKSQAIDYHYIKKELILIKKELILKNLDQLFLVKRSTFRKLKSTLFSSSLFNIHTLSIFVFILQKKESDL